MKGEEIRSAIAANITDLRKKSGMTQQDLAIALHYTDKAVSKWERGESIPDVVVLKSVADLFGVPVDYLLTTEHGEFVPDPLPYARTKRRHLLIMGISILLVWLIATLIFVVVSPIRSSAGTMWLVFLYAVPVSAIVWLVFNSVWFNRKINYLIVSLLMWSTLCSLHLSLVVARIENPGLWMVYLLGIPGQIILLLWSGMGWTGKKRFGEARRAEKKRKEERKNEDEDH